MKDYRFQWNNINELSLICPAVCINVDNYTDSLYFKDGKLKIIPYTKLEIMKRGILAILNTAQLCIDRKVPIDYVKVAHTKIENVKEAEWSKEISLDLPFAEIQKMLEESQDANL